MRYLKRSIALVAVVAVMVSAMAGLWLHAQATHAAAIVSSSCGQWTIVPSVNPSPSIDVLDGVAAISPSDAWAVGVVAPAGGSPSSTLTEQWNGSAWSLVASPNVTNSTQNSLSSVAAISASDVWAVGEYLDNTLGEFLTLTEHWNGSNWSIVPSPDVGQDGGSLNSVSADASSDVWAVGSYDNLSVGGSAALIEHWNGTSWVIFPNPGDSLSEAVLNSVVALSPSNVWAVGEYLGGTAGGQSTLVEHWDGTSWSVISSPNDSPADNYLYGVTATGPNNLWAVGYVDFYNSSQTASLTEHWDGTSWQVVSSYEDFGNNTNLDAVTQVPGSQQVFAVGHELYGNNTSLVTQWTGSSWNRMLSASQPNATNGLTSVTALSASDAWAVGEYAVPTSSGASRLLTRMHRSSTFSGVPNRLSLILHYQAPARGMACA